MLLILSWVYSTFSFFLFCYILFLSGLSEDFVHWHFLGFFYWVKIICSLFTYCKWIPGNCTLTLVGMHSIAVSVWAVKKISQQSFAVYLSHVSWRVPNFQILLLVGNAVIGRNSFKRGVCQQFPAVLMNFLFMNIWSIEHGLIITSCLSKRYIYIYI